MISECATIPYPQCGMPSISQRPCTLLAFCGVLLCFDNMIQLPLHISLGIYWWICRSSECPCDRKLQLLTTNGATCDENDTCRIPWVLYSSSRGDFLQKQLHSLSTQLSMQGLWTIYCYSIASWNYTRFERPCGVWDTPAIDMMPFVRFVPGT